MPERGRWPPAQALRRLDYTTLVPGATATGGGEDGGEAESRVGTAGRGPRIVGRRGERRRERGKDKGPRRRPIFPRSHPRSIVGAGAFHFRVREGNGWSHPAKATEILIAVHCSHARPGRQPRRGVSQAVAAATHSSLPSCRSYLKVQPRITPDAEERQHHATRVVTNDCPNSSISTLFIK